MKLGEIKLMALKLMFADSDVTYALADIATYYENSNTRDKLVRMTDSINRALSLYYQRVGLPRGKATVNLDAEGGESTYFFNTIANLPAQITDLQNILKVRITSSYRAPLYNADFEFDGTEIVFTNLTHYITAAEEDTMTIEIFYEKTPTYLIAGNESDTVFDFDTIDIPTEIQLQIPKFIKGEAYEEDEPQMAMYAKNEFLNYLQLVKKPKIIKQQRVVTKNWNQ